MTAVGGATSGRLAVGERVLLRPIVAADEAEFTELARASAAAHYPWMELPTTAAEFAVFLARFTPPVVNVGVAVCTRDTGVMTGGINVNNIVRGRFQSAALGYWAFVNTTRGYMSEALRLLISYAFGDLDLHRLEANVQPGNEASARLVLRNGFRHEGRSPDYLFINGAWRDHDRYAITREMVAG